MNALNRLFKKERNEYLAIALMLAFMSIPTICSISEDAIFSVPIELKEASLALGATQWETIARVIVPASLSGICTAVILGMARALDYLEKNYAPSAAYRRAPINKALMPENPYGEDS